MKITHHGHSAGPIVDPKPPGSKPDMRPLHGLWVMLEPVSAETHARDLYDSFAGHDPHGHIWMSPGLQKTREATEAIFLMIRHCFDDLGVRRLEWKCDALNAPSRKAAERFGFTFEGIFRQHMIVKDRNRDTAWYAMLDKDWHRVRAGFEAWLKPGNFDAKGHQKAKLQVG